MAKRNTTVAKTLEVSRTKKRSPLLYPTNRLVEMHLNEIAEECSRILGYISVLHNCKPDSEVYLECEGQLYAALTHLQNHVPNALKEMDKLLDELPNGG